MPLKAFYWLTNVALVSLLNMNQNVLAEIIEKLAKGEHIKPETEAENRAFRLLMTWIMSQEKCMVQQLVKNI